ncbi:hypothetical protein Syun_005068 [Stephania yunnanensis]|uniref:U-box domain-containing protein n=1 Tax=Stephania yunnanensis TaxID=152371 RepID=A0AAP0L4E6_9MAGN
MKDLISRWSSKYGMTVADPCEKRIPASLLPCKTLSKDSVASFDISLKGVPLKNDYCSVSFSSSIASLNSSHSKISAGLNVDSPQEDDSQKFQLCERNNHDPDADFLSKLDELPWESQCKLLEDFKKNLEGKGSHSILSTRSFKALVRFSKDACDRCDVLALRVGAQVLLMFVSKSRNEIQSLCEEAFNLLVTFLDSEITEEALAIAQVLSGDPDCQSELVASGVLPPIIRILESPLRKFQASSVKILIDLSSNSNIDSEIIRLGCVPKLIQLLSDSLVSEFSVQILKNLCKTEEGRIAIAETKGSIASVAELLEGGNHEEQEHGVDVLLSLCSHNVKYCHLVLNEGVIPSLVTISVNGNDGAKEIALQLLRLLRDMAYDDHQESPVTIDVLSNPEFPQDPDNCFVEKKPPSKPGKSFMKRIKALLLCGEGATF